MKPLLIFLLTVLGTLTQPRSPVAAADWPVFRGDAAQTGLAAEPLPDELVVRWQARTGGDTNTANVEGTAAIAGGIAFVGAYDDHLHAYDLRHRAGEMEAQDRRDQDGRRRPRRPRLRRHRGRHPFLHRRRHRQ